MTCSFLVTLLVVCALGSAQVEHPEPSSTASDMVGVANSAQGNAVQLSLRSDPVVRRLLNFHRRSAEHEVHSVHRDVAETRPRWSPSSANVHGETQRVETVDSQSDQFTLRRKGTPISDGSVDAARSSVDQKAIVEPPQVPKYGKPGYLASTASGNNDGAPEPRDAGAPVHDAKPKAIISHHEPKPSLYDPPADPVGKPTSDTENYLKTQVPMPDVGPFPPNSVPDPEPDERLFVCDFNNHDCGMRNQKNIGQNFHREFNELAGKPGYRMVVHSERVGYNLSRLITPYLPGYANTTACLSILYVLDGEGADSIAIVAQDTSNHPLFRLKEKGLGWRFHRHSMPVPQDVRFFIEAYTKSRAEGVIAIDKFSYSLAPC